MTAHATPICHQGIICAIVRETERAGWPHKPTAREETAATWHVLRQAHHGKSARCTFNPLTIGRATCRVTFTDGTHLLVGFRSWEDGSYALLLLA